MLKHYNLIYQLSDRDKLRLLCDIHALEDERFLSLGIPTVRVGELEAYLSGQYPSSAALANSWDKELIASVAKSTAAKMAADHVNLAVIPSPKIKINPFRPALSEDALLATANSREYFKAVKDASMAACLDDFRLTSRESSWMDQTPNERFICEYLVKPYSEVAALGGCAAILTDSSHIADEYQDANHELTKMVANGAVAKGALPISRKLPSEHTVSHFVQGGLAFEASSLLLEAALARFKQLKKDIERGKATAEELEQEILAGKAISEEMIDAAIDRLIEFAFSLKRDSAAPAFEADAALGERAVAESVVMLKNEDRLLPMKKNTRVCVIGDLASAEFDMADQFASELESRGYRYVGFARGYELAAERSDKCLAEADDLVDRADVAIVFAGFGAERQKRLHKMEKLSLPANQLSLLNRLHNSKIRVITVMPSECCPDVVKTAHSNAILMAPLDTPYSASVLARVLDGSINPCGRLASTVYIESDTLYKEYKTYRYRDGIQTGPFIGYRYYDTAGFYPGYPFGFGLSYTTFAYSGLTVSRDSISFTVKNTGRSRGTAVAQVYVGVRDSAVVRPRMELMNFARVELAPGKRQRVTLPLSLPVVYDAAQRAWLIERGKYVVGVGDSIGEISATASFDGGKHLITPDGHAMSDYIQSESNIIKDHYKLESRSETMKKSPFNFIVGSSALALAVVLKLFCVFAKIDAAFFDVVAALIAFGGIVLFIREAVQRNRAYHELQDALDQKNEEAFADAEHLSTYNSAQMFANEFDRVDETHPNDDIYTEAVETEYLKHIDKELDFSAAAREFEIYATEKGFRLEAGTVKNIFASLASSRLLITDGMDEESFHDLLLLLSGYFETNIYVDRVDENYTTANSVLFGSDAYGTRVRTNVYSAIEQACSDLKKIHFASLTNVHAADLINYFNPYVNYIKNPLANCHVTALNDKHVESTYRIPPNVWFIMNLAPGETVDSIPDFVSEVATLNHVHITKCEPAQHMSAFHNFTYYQMEYLVEKLASAFEIDEEVWKRIDRLEAYVNKYVPYHIGNKLWLCMEKYALVHIACESETADAVDEAVCAKLMPTMVMRLKNKLPKDERSFAETVEMIFGEGRVDRCLRFIKTCRVELT